MQGENEVMSVGKSISIRAYAIQHKQNKNCHKHTQADL